MIKTVLTILAMQLAFGAVMGVSILMGQQTDHRCRPTKRSSPPFKDCHPYPEKGAGAMACTWIGSDHQPFPWAISRRCDGP